MGAENSQIISFLLKEVWLEILLSLPLGMILAYSIIFMSRNLLAEMTAGIFILYLVPEHAVMTVMILIGSQMITFIITACRTMLLLKRSLFTKEKLLFLHKN